MTRNQVKEILGRVLTWPPDDHEKLARFVHEVVAGLTARSFW
jgi:hypothetical protein